MNKISFFSIFIFLAIFSSILYLTYIAGKIKCYFDILKKQNDEIENSINKIKDELREIEAKNILLYKLYFNENKHSY